MSRKHKFTSPIAILTQKQWKAISIKSKLDLIDWLEKVNKLFIPAPFLAQQKSALHTVCVGDVKVISSSTLLECTPVVYRRVIIYIDCQWSDFPITPTYYIISYGNIMLDLCSFLYTPFLWTQLWCKSRSPQIVHSILYMNGNTQEWTWLTDCNSMLSSHNILQAYLMQIIYSQWFVYQYLMLCHSGSVQFFTLRN